MAMNELRNFFQILEGGEPITRLKHFYFADARQKFKQRRNSTPRRILFASHKLFQNFVEKFFAGVIIAGMKF